MFGHSNNDNQANGVQPADPVAEPSLVSHEPETIAPSAAPIASAPTATENPIDDYVMTDLPHVAAPDKPAPVASPVASTPTVVSGDFSQPTAPTPADGSSDLLELKQSALHELSPLIGHLEQSPEEKFRTTMMMIQASDDQSMLQSAFAAAKDIKDEKARAQALLDVVNEINYFTQQHTDAA